MKIARNRIGFMQGRLSPIERGKIQAFPWRHWREEFALAEASGLSLMEWTLDQDGLHENPLLTSAGRRDIAALCARHAVSIPSLTGDCFMQAPFWKAEEANCANLQRDFRSVAEACVLVGISTIVVPLVDNGRLENREQEDTLVEYLVELSDFLERNELRVAFESDFGPAALANFIDRLEPKLFSVNYDIGNSAAVGNLPADELAAYGHRITNVHVKDRILGGTTVPLGCGSADFDAAFAALGRIGFRGNYILQTARAEDGDHAFVLSRYRDMTVEWMTRYGA
jgi:L-ribulose-5-phosphate 3-epimerase